MGRIKVNGFSSFFDSYWKLALSFSFVLKPTTGQLVQKTEKFISSMFSFIFNLKISKPFGVIELNKIKSPSTLNEG